MDPFTLMSLIGGGTSLISNLFGPKETMPTQINPLTDQYYQDILGELSNWNSQQSGAMANAETARGRVEGSAKQAEDIRNRQGNVNAPGADDWFDDFMEEQIPGYRAQAQAAAEMATRGGSAGQAERAQKLSEDAARTVAGQFAGSGGMFSGGMGEAVGQGAANPIADYQNQLGNQYQNAFMGAYTPLAGQGQSLAYQGQQDAFSNAMNQLAQQLQSTQLAGNMYGNSMGGALNAGQLYGSRAQGAEANRHDVAQPVWASPTQSPNAMATFGQGLSNLGMMGSSFMNSPSGAQNTNNTNPWGRYEIPGGGSYGGNLNVPGMDYYTNR